MIETKINISISKLDQFEHENNTWERALDFFKQENAFLKTRLSVIIDNKDDKEFIKLAEYFQNQFLLKDEFIKELKTDLNRQNDEIKLYPKSKMPNAIVNSQETLRKEMSYFETDFSRLKNEFHRLIIQFL